MSFYWDSTTSADLTATVFTEVTANLVFSDDDVRAVYIDWDDGTDPDGNFSNERDYANYQWVQTTKPTGTLTAKHTYTSTGTFKPVIQTINSDGIVSAFYGSEATNSEVSPYFQGSGDYTHYNLTGADGQATGILNVENKRVLSGIDNSILEVQGGKDLYVTIPPLETAANMAYLGDIELELTLEVEDALMGPTVPSEAQAGYGKTIQTITKTITSTNVTGGAGMDQIDSSDGLKGVVSQVLKVRWMNPKYSGTSRDDDYTINQAYNKINIFIVTKASVDGTTTYHPVTYVTAGRPIKSINDPTRFVTLDFSQSRAKAANVSNLQYRYDVGKVFFNPVFQWNTVSGSAYNASHYNNYQFLGNNTVLSGTSSKNVSYAYNSVRPNGLNGKEIITTPSIAFGNDSNDGWNIDDGTSQVYRTNQFLIDDYGRFTPQYHLARVSMQPASQLATATPAAAYPPTSTTTELTSPVNANKPLVFRCTPAIASPGPGDSGMPWSTTPSTADLWKWSSLDFAVGSNDNHTGKYMNEAFRNGSTQMVSLSGMNAANFVDGVDGNPRTANEYILLMWPKKTNKIFFNINNYAKDLISKNISGSSFSSGWDIAGVSYLHIDNGDSSVVGTADGATIGSGINQDVYWKSIPFEDTTKISLEYKDTSNKKYVEQSNSLSQSGYISFDMPLDWDACNMEQLCGGYFAEQIRAHDDALSAWEFQITGNMAAASFNPDGTYGNYLEFTRTAGATLTDIWNTKEDCGAFKYIAYPLTWTGSAGHHIIKRPFWIVGEDGASGWDGSTKLYCLYGKDVADYWTATGLTNVGVGDVVLGIRRINVYDVFNGVSKVNSSGDTNIWIPTEAMQTSDSYYGQTYVCSSSASADVTGLTTAFGRPIYYNFKTADHYLLKISLSGSVSTDAFPEVWNVFDATESHVEVIKEIDDSAYNLNSLAVTNEMQVTRAGTYYRAISKKGKVFISRTGDAIQTLRFSSVALGRDGTIPGSHAPTSWSSSQSPAQSSSLYGHLHMVRKLQQDNVDVYWDEKQKDGTYVRFWGIITDLNETHKKGGPSALVDYSFTFTVKEIALLDTSSKLMTDVFPLGGIQSAASYT